MTDFRHVYGDGSSFPHRLNDLNMVMEMDHAVRVCADGNVYDCPLDGPEYPWAPELNDGELSQHHEHDGWSFFTAGYSGAYGQADSPIMHDSEFIGGRLARDILAQPGFYVALVNSLSDAEDDYIEGWAVAFKPAD